MAVVSLSVTTIEGWMSLTASAAMEFVDLMSATGAMVLTGTAAMTLSRSMSVTGAMVLAGTAAMTLTNSSLYALGTLRMTGTGDVTIVNSSFSASGYMRLTSSAALDAGIPFKATGAMSLQGTAQMPVALNLAAQGDMVFGLSASLDRGRDALGVCEVAREILLLWGIEYPCKAPAWAIEAAVIDLNTALQMVWNRARDRSYWTRETITVTLAAGVSSQLLDDDVQNVIGPARFDATKKPLMVVGSRSEIDQFTDAFLDGDSSGGPLGYHVDRGVQDANDPARCTFMVAPAPGSQTSFLLDVVREAPRFSINDVTTCPRIPIPHKYVESLLLPVCRFLALQRHIAVASGEARKQIEEAFREASGLLEEADPLPGKSGDNAERRKESQV